MLSSDQDFHNNSGADAISATGRWLVYSTTPEGNTYGGLNSGNTAIWNATLATLAAGSVSGDRYVFAYQPTLTFSSVDDSKTYGDALTGSAFTVTGYHAGVTGAFLGDSPATAFGGSAGMSSSGYAANADVAGGPYGVTIAAGSLTSASGYAFAFDSSGKLTVDPKAITGVVVVNNKTYDGTTDATGGLTLNGVLDGDSISGSATYVFGDKSAGTDKTVYISNGSLSGDDAGNYTLTIPATVMADILQKAITGTVSVGDKTYDGTTAATGSVTLSGVIGGDSVSGSANFAFADKNAGADKTVNVTNGSLSGDDAGNYTLTIPATVMADILQKAITGTVFVDDKTYDGTTAATGSMTLNGVVAGDNVSGGANFAFTDANAGAGKSVQVHGAALTGADAGNYTLTVSATAMADILQRVLVIVANDASKVEGQADPSLGYMLAQGSLVGTDSLTGSLSRNPGEAPGLYDILQGSLSAGQNYAITFESGVLTITSAGPVTSPPPGPLPVAGFQPVRATPLPAQVRGPAKASSPIVLQPGIFCDPEKPCQAR